MLLMWFCWLSKVRHIRMLQSCTVNLANFWCFKLSWKTQLKLMLKWYRADRNRFVELYIKGVKVAVFLMILDKEAVKDPFTLTLPMIRSNNWRLIFWRFIFGNEVKMHMLLKEREYCTYSFLFLYSIQTY